MTMTIRLRPLFTLLTCVVPLSALLSAQGPLLTSSPTRAYASAGFTIAPTAGLFRNVGDVQLRQWRWLQPLPLSGLLRHVGRRKRPI